MTRVILPVIPVLELWKEGFSTGEIAVMLGYRNRKAVSTVIGQARSIGDRRAVYHFTNGRIIGKGIPPAERMVQRRQTTYRGFALVELQLKAMCVNGHLRTPENVDRHHHCIACNRAFDKRRSHRKRKPK